MSVCLSDLAETLNALLPDCPTGKVCRQVVDASAGCVALKHLPADAPTLASACGATITADQYLMDYTSGMLYTCVDDGKILVSYAYNLAETYIRQAVRDLGTRLPQRNTICLPLFANCGLAPLPCHFQRIEWLRVSDCLCGQPSCTRCENKPRCSCSLGFAFDCGPLRPGSGQACSLYQRGDLLVVASPPCTDQMLHLCYLGGYPLDKNGCFDGLTAELADLVLLKAQALAYSNPKLFLDLSGVSSSNESNTSNRIDTTTTTTSNDVGSEDDAYQETVTVAKVYGTCGKETGSTTTKSGTRNKDKANQATKQVKAAEIRAASVTSQAAASLLSSTQWLSLSRQFQADYEKGLLVRTESANVGRACATERRGYRSRIRN